MFRHYQDAYATLTIMFGSTAILPPRTKRWAEAKVLADCINIKVKIGGLLSHFNDVLILALDCQAVSVQQRNRACLISPQLAHSSIQRFLARLGHR